MQFAAEGLMYYMKKSYIAAFVLSLMITTQFAVGINAEAADKKNVSHVYNKQEIVEKLCADKSLTALSLLTDGISDESKTAILPKSYSLREEGIVTPVKDQGKYGMCWSFAAMNSIESSLVKKDSDIDLSEWIPAYYTYCKQFGFPLYDKNNTIFDQGGMYKYSSSMLAAGIGAFDERYDKWYYGDESILKSKRSADDVRAMRDYQITDIEYFSYWQDNDAILPYQIHAIQNAVYNGHSLVLNYAHFDDCYSDKKASYFTSDNCIENADEFPLHSVNIIGWDDNYSSENFLNKPDRDGAWLCKNSWGEDWGDGGYFWLSYADPTIYDIFYLDAESSEKYNDIHIYDNYGATNFISSEKNLTTTFDYMANVFTADEDCFVTATMLSTSKTDEKYDISVYTELSDPNDPCSGKLCSTISGSLPNAGYHTIDFETPAFVSAGDNYSIVVKLSGDSGYHISCEGYIDYEIFYKDGSSEYVDDEMKNHILNNFKKGQSFISSDGIKWSDNYENGTHEYEIKCNDTEKEKYVYYEVITNNSIKSFTKPVDSVIFSEYSYELPLGTDIKLESPSGNEIKYSINGSPYQTYDSPIVFDGDMVISAYTNENNIFEKKYVQQKAVLSSVLMNNGIKNKYIYETEKGSGRYTEHVPISEDSVCLQLISTGDIYIDGTKITSGENYNISLNNGINDINVSVSEEGKITNQYTLTFIKVKTMVGDANADGVINIADAEEVFNIYTENAVNSQNDKSNAHQYSNADVNGDGKIDIADAMLILKYYSENASK